MQRVGEQALHRRLFDHLAGIHHHHALRHFGDHAKVVCDQQQRHPQFGLQLTQQLQDLRLYRDVERRGRLVGNQQFGLAGHGDRDHHALAHAARQAVRIFIDTARRIGDAHQVQQFDGTAARFGARQVFVQAQGLADLVGDGQHRVQRRHRVLEHHRHFAAAQLAQLAVRHGQHVFAAVANGALQAAGAWLVQAQHRQRGHALAAARFTDQADAFARPHLQRHVLDGGRPAFVTAELHRELVDLQQRLHHVSTFSRGSSTSRRPSPRRFMLSAARLIARPGNSMIHQASTE